MRTKTRIWLLSALLFFATGSTALGVYYYTVYSPPLETAEAFMQAMEAGDRSALASLLRISSSRDSAELRPATPEEISGLLDAPFQRGRILDQRKREGPRQAFHYLVYREPDGQIYAVVVAEREGLYHIVIPEDPPVSRAGYLWDYAWTN